MSVKKRILEVTIFLLVMFLTFYTLFSGKNLGEIANAVSKMSVGYLVPAAALAIFFVCAEGYMIWYLLQAMKANRRKEGSSLIRCIQYSFIGFFYSGITPSATGGQPVQLYYMSKDGNRGSDSTVVLMTVAVVYKFVLVILGAAILLFWYRPLYSELGKFFPLYLFGLLLNVILVVVIQGPPRGRGTRRRRGAGRQDQGPGRDRQGQGRCIRQAVRQGHRQGGCRAADRPDRHRNRQKEGRAAFRHQGVRQL